MPIYDFRQRPLASGLQIVRPATPKQAAGTIGCFVTGQDGRRYLLTAGHVLDPAKKPNSGLTATSDNNIYQPNDVAGNAIGSMRWNAVCYGNYYVDNVPMGIDAGIFQLDPAVEYKNYAWRIGDITGIAEPKEDDLVMKHGRTTGLTYGVIKRITANANTSSTPLLNMIEVEYRTPAQVGLEGNDVGNFCEEGDSGAALINKDRQIVGIVHAQTGTAGNAYATRAMAIFKYMQLNFINCVAQPPK